MTSDPNLLRVLGAKYQTPEPKGMVLVDTLPVVWLDKKDWPSLSENIVTGAVETWRKPTLWERIMGHG